MDKNDILVDFLVIPANDPKYLVIADVSYWGRIKNKPTIIEITTPGSREAITKYFRQEETNILNSFNLEVSSDSKVITDLPDGIYQITLKGSPSNYNKTRNYLKTDKIRLKLYKLYTDLGLNLDEWDSSLKDNLQIIEMLITQAEGYAINGDIRNANTVYNQAKKLIDKNGCTKC